MVQRKVKNDNHEVRYPLALMIGIALSLQAGQASRAGRLSVENLSQKVGNIINLDISLNQTTVDLALKDLSDSMWPNLGLILDLITRDGLENDWLIVP